MHKGGNVASIYFGLGASRICDDDEEAALLDDEAEPTAGDVDKSMTCFSSVSESDEDRADLLRRTGVLKGSPVDEATGGGSKFRILLARRCAIFSLILSFRDLGRAALATTSALLAAARQISARRRRTREQYWAAPLGFMRNLLLNQASFLFG